MIDQKTPTKKELRVFGIVLALAFMLLAVFAKHAGHEVVPIVLACFAALFAFMGILLPDRLQKLFVYNRLFGKAVSKIIAFVLSFITFMVYFLPTGVYRRIAGNHFLNSKSRPGLSPAFQSFWQVGKKQYSRKFINKPYSDQAISNDNNAEKTWVRKPVAVLIVISLLLVASEFSVRSYYYLKHGSWMPRSQRALDSQLYDRHPYLQSVPKPNASFSRNDPDSYRYSININKWGFRGREVSLIKPRGTIRVAAIGGSTTFCTQLNDQDTWPLVLERLLKKNNHKVEVLNFGVPGYNTLQELILLESRALDFQPDIVIIYAGYNDLKFNNLPGAKFNSDYSQTFSSGQGRLPDWLHKYLLEKSAALIILEGKLINMKAKKSASSSSHLIKRTSALDVNATKTFMRNLESMKHLCLSRGIDVVFVSEARAFDSSTQNAPTLTKTASSALFFTSQLNIEGLERGFDEYAKAMANVALSQAAQGNEKCLFIDAHAKIPRSSKYYVDSVHFNKLGSKRMAELLLPDVSALIKRRR